MAIQRVPHAAINTLMQWVRKKGQQVRTLTTWPQATNWMAHLELRGTRPLHARITPRGWRFTVARVAEEPACPVCTGQVAAGDAVSPGLDNKRTPKVSFGGY
jgi:hypothetical protein